MNKVHSSEHIEPAVTKKDLRPLWLQFVDTRPKAFVHRQFLGGNDFASSIFSFARDVFHFKGTVLFRCFFPAILSGLIGMLVAYSDHHVLIPDTFIQVYTIVLVLVLGLRLVGSWESYRRGHEHVLQMGTSCSDALLACATCIHVRNSGLDMLEMVRRLNLLLALIRQDLRESRQHLADYSSFKSGNKKSRLARESFAEGDYFLDDIYGSPPLGALLTEGEIAVYRNHSTSERTVIAVVSIRTYFARFVHFGQQKMSTPDSKMFQNHIERIISSWNKCRQIIVTPAPFVLQHFALGLMLVFTMVFLPLYLSQDIATSFFLCSTLTFVTYGIEEAACEMEVPFGWRNTDANLTKMCRKFLKDSGTICKVCKVSFNNEVSS